MILFPLFWWMLVFCLLNSTFRGLSWESYICSSEFSVLSLSGIIFPPKEKYHSCLYSPSSPSLLSHRISSTALCMAFSEAMNEPSLWAQGGHHISISIFMVKGDWLAWGWGTVRVSSMSDDTWSESVYVSLQSCWVVLHQPSHRGQHLRSRSEPFFPSLHEHELLPPPWHHLTSAPSRLLLHSSFKLHQLFIFNFLSSPLPPPSVPSASMTRLARSRTASLTSGGSVEGNRSRACTHSDSTEGVGAVNQTMEVSCWRGRGEGGGEGRRWQRFSLCLCCFFVPHCKVPHVVAVKKKLPLHPRCQTLKPSATVFVSFLYLRSLSPHSLPASL